MDLLDHLRSVHNAGLLSISVQGGVDAVSIGPLGPDLTMVSVLMEDCRRLINRASDNDLIHAFYRSMSEIDDLHVGPLRSEMKRRGLKIID